MAKVLFVKSVGAKYVQTQNETNVLSVNAHPHVHKKAVKRGTSQKKRRRRRNIDRTGSPATSAGFSFCATPRQNDIMHQFDAPCKPTTT